MKVSILFALSAFAHPCSVTSFFVPVTQSLSSAHVSSASITTGDVVNPILMNGVGRTTSQTQLFMAGFGTAGGASKKDNKKVTLPKLKAKTQWDRYADLKQCKKVRVGVRSQDGDWMEVGRVRSENDEHTLVAIARQRALIADHAKRLYPVQIPTNSVLEWGYVMEDNDNGDDASSATWVAVDKSSGADAPKGIEKKFGFEGISDKASGFYCYYSEGRVVERGETLATALTTGSKSLPN